MENLVIILVIGFIVGMAAGYIYKAKKRGVKCVGCPDSGTCGRNCSSCSCSCGK